MKTVTVWNQKGGVGKSTLAFNIAAILARKEKRVLCLDMDTQCNLTSYFDVERTRSAGRPTIKEVLEQGLTAKSGIYSSKRFSNLFYIRGAYQRIESGIEAMTTIVKDAGGLNKFDVCIIDTHPDDRELSMGAIASADLVLVPVKLDGFSQDNLNLVQKTVNDVSDYAGREIPFRVVVNFLANREYQREIYQNLVQNHDYPIMNTCISEQSCVGSALNLRRPLYMHRKNAQVTQDLEELVTALGEEITWQA